jgi:hypothetical protein
VTTHLHLVSRFMVLCSISFAGEQLYLSPFFILHDRTLKVKYMKKSAPKHTSTLWKNCVHLKYVWFSYVNLNTFDERRQLSYCIRLESQCFHCTITSTKHTAGESTMKN